MIGATTTTAPQPSDEHPAPVPRPRPQAPLRDGTGSDGDAVTAAARPVLDVAGVQGAEVTDRTSGGGVTSGGTSGGTPEVPADVMPTSRRPPPQCRPLLSSRPPPPPDGSRTTQQPVAAFSRSRNPRSGSTTGALLSAAVSPPPTVGRARGPRRQGHGHSALCRPHGWLGAAFLGFLVVLSCLCLLTGFVLDLI